MWKQFFSLGCAFIVINDVEHRCTWRPVGRDVVESRYLPQRHDDGASGQDVGPVVGVRDAWEAVGFDGM